MNTNLDNIKELRNRTGAGIGDCKKVLEECDGDVEKAIDKLRTIGVIKACKQSDRTVSDGLVALHLSDNTGVLLELNCETDFVARNDRFIKFAQSLASIACGRRCANVDDLKNIEYSNTSTVEEAIISESAVLGERLVLGNISYIEAEDGGVAGYVHGSASCPGKVGALVTLKSNGNKEDLVSIGKQIAMHIVAMKPEALSIENLDQEKLQNERSIIEKQLASLNKPENVMQKILEGRLAKYYEEVVLLEQRFIKDDKMSIAGFIQSKASSLGCSINLSDYRLLALGQ